MIIAGTRSIVPLASQDKSSVLAALRLNPQPELGQIIARPLGDRHGVRSASADGGP
jgi:hypothetical protein